jgi:hypothetical protein
LHCGFDFCIDIAFDTGVGFVKYPKLDGLASGTGSGVGKGIIGLEYNRTEEHGEYRS